MLHQAEFLSFKVFEGVDFPPGTVLLEPGCGVGAQTRILLRKFPQIKVIAFDRSENAIEAAKADFPNELKDRVEFHCTDIFNFHPAVQADGIFICWMLEHVPRPIEIMKHLLQFIKPGGFFMATEVQNNTLQVFPRSNELDIYWDAYNRLQIDLQGDPFVGVKVASYLERALPGKFSSIDVWPGNFLVDLRDPVMLKNMCHYWLNLMESARDAIEEKAYCDRTIFAKLEKHFEELPYRADGLFSYTFFRTTGRLAD